MADKKPKGGPGAKPASTTLRVTDPNDSRLKMYKDSVTATGRAIADTEFIKKMADAPNKEAKKMFNKGVSSPPEAISAISRLEMANRKPYKEGVNRSARPATLEADKGLGYNKGDSREVPGGKFEVVNVYPKKIVSPKREVVLVKPPRPKPKPAPERKVSEPIEPMQPRYSEPQKFAKEEPEMVAPVVRPVKKELKETRAGLGSILRYPSQDLMSKVKRKLTGESNMPYWEDKEGVKRYPSKGENNPKDVQEKEMLKKD